MKASGTNCPHCGKPVPATALQGICPECMLKAGLTDTGEVGPGGTVIAPSPPNPAPPISEIAPHFPQLEILECLGRGGMGAVYKARQPKLDRLVALKILSRKYDEGPPDAAFAERFQREARALARLNHPDIVAVYDFGESGGFHYLVMEYVDGLTLRQLLQAGKLPPEQALAIVPKICEALQFAHERGIVHRDIKPENILLDKQGCVKIADFGIAKIVGQPAQATLTQERQIIGTPHYMAPEQVEKPATVDHRADIFSLGVIFYEMLTGELPLGKFAPPSRKVQVDVRLDEVVLHALEKEPERRYQHASEVKTDVETIVASGPKPEVRTARPEISAARRGIDSVGGPILAAAVLFAILASATVFGWLASDKSFSLPAALGAVAAVTVVVVSFGVWLVSSVTRSLSRQPSSSPSPVSGPSSGERERIRREVRGPAIGLLVTGILNWILIPLAVLVGLWILPLEMRGHLPALPYTLVKFGSVGLLALCSFIIYAALKMMQLEGHRTARLAGVAAMVVSPGNIVGLPIGIWTLVVLNRKDVRAAFKTLPASANIPALPPRWVIVLRWTARCLGTLLLLFYGVAILAEGLPPIAAQSGGVQLNFAALGLMLLGFIVGWKREDAAALLIAAGWTLWHISEGRMQWNIFQTPLPVALLYCFCWWGTHGRPTGSVATAALVLLAALGLGRLFVPSNVFVRGAVLDAETGSPVPNAELRLLPRPAITAQKGDAPNARSGKDGRFSLFVGWYAADQGVAIAANRYVSLRTNLGPRALGSRTVSRDFALQPESPFDDVVERKLYSVTAERPIKGEDLDGQREIVVPGGLENAGEQQFFHWVAREGVDLMAWGHKRRWTLWASPQLVTADTDLWNLPTPAKLQAALVSGRLTGLQRGSDSSNGYDSYTFATNTELPLTLAFKTLEGRSGILQILSASDAPKALEVRYRVWRRAAAENANDASAGAAPPVVIATVPESGATEVDPAQTELRVTFSKPMLDGNWAWTKWGEENFPEMTGQPKFLADGRTCVLPVRLQPGKVYATWLNSDYFQDFKDRDGQSAVPYLLIFETRK